MSMLTNNKQEVADVQNSVVNQAQGNIIIHNGITAETAMEICRCVVKSELAIYTQQANETAYKRLDEISEKTIDRISSLKQDLLQRFNEPAIQMALNETFKSHIAAGDEELEDDLIDLMIERLNVQDRTTEQAIIDEARRIIPKLSPATIALLTVIVFSKLIFPYNKMRLEILIKNLSQVISRINNISILDTEYLKQVGCCTGTPILTVNTSLEQTFMQDYELIFRDPLPIECFNKILNKYSRGNLNKVRVILSLFDYIENSFLCKIPRQKSINEQIYDVIDKVDLDAMIDEYKAETKALSENEIREYFVNIDPNWQQVFQLFNQRCLQSIQLTPVGIYIGIRQLSKICGEPIPMELFFQ